MARAETLGDGAPPPFLPAEPPPSPAICLARGAGAFLLLVSAFLPWWDEGPARYWRNTVIGLLADVGHDFGRDVGELAAGHSSRWDDVGAELLAFAVILAPAALCLLTVTAMILQGRGLASWERPMAVGAVTLSFPAVIGGLPFTAVGVIQEGEPFLFVPLTLHALCAGAMIASIFAAVRRWRRPSLLLQSAAYLSWVGAMLTAFCGLCYELVQHPNYYSNEWLGAGFFVAGAGAVALFAGTAAATWRAREQILPPELFAPQA